MFAKLSTAFALFTLAAQVVATPPACLIAAIGKNAKNPSDVHSICSSPDSVQSYLSSNCGDAADDAQSAFISTCKDAGVTVASPTTSDSTQTSSGFTTSVTGAHSTSGAHATTTKTGLGASATSPTSSHSSTSPTGSVTPGTGAASRLGMDVFGMITIGALGAMIAGAM